MHVHPLPRAGVHVQTPIQEIPTMVFNEVEILTVNGYRVAANLRRSDSVSLSPDLNWLEWSAPALFGY